MSVVLSRCVGRAVGAGRAAAALSEHASAAAAVLGRHRAWRGCSGRRERWEIEPHPSGMCLCFDGLG